MPTTAPIAPPEPVVPPPARPASGETRILIPTLSWAGYESLLAEIGDGHLRINYLEGTAELMSPGSMHEGPKSLLGRMVEALTEELDIPLKALGSTTLRRRDVARGAEADESFYLANAARLAAMTTELDLNVLPPPDLVIEVVVTAPLLDKLAIYAGLGVPEVWRHDGGRLIVLLLDPDGRYAESPTSLAFPFLPMAAFAERAHNQDRTNDTRWARSFRAWVRDVVAPLYQP